MTQGSPDGTAGPDATAAAAAEAAVVVVASDRGQVTAPVAAPGGHAAQV